MSSKILPSGHTYIELDDTNGDGKLRNLWFMYTDGVIKLIPEGWILPKNYISYAKRIYDFKWKQNDTLVLTYPKSGTTWSQEIIWNLADNPNLENPIAGCALDIRFPYFESDIFMRSTGAPTLDEEEHIMKAFRVFCKGKDPKIDGLMLSMFPIVPSPRLVKSHLPFSLFPKDLTSRCKVVYVLRDPRDVVYSMFHYSRLQITFGFRGDLDEFVDEVVNDRIVFGPYWQHLKLAWDKRSDSNLFLIFYEDLKEDVVKEIKRIDKFLGTNRTDYQIAQIAKFTSFDEMKTRYKNCPPTSIGGKLFNKKVAEKEGGFFRKGLAGAWKNNFNEQQIEKLNAWMAKNLVKFGKDFKYKV